MPNRLWAGLDVGIVTTNVCVINDLGEVLHEAACPSLLKNVHRELAFLRRRRHARVGLEAATGMTLARGLRSLGYSVDIYEARQLSKFLRIRRNKTDSGDARGIAEAGRIGASTVSKVHLKSLDCQMLQSQLAIRRHLVRQRVAAVNLLARQVELYGGRLRWRKLAHLRPDAEAELKTLFGKSSTPLTCELRHLIDHCEQLIIHQLAVDRDLKLWADENETCRRFMEIPGVGPLCALSFYAAVGEPSRFPRSADIASYLGLAPRIYQSGISCRQGRISKMGNKIARGALVGAATSFMRWSVPDSELRLWTLGIEQRRGRGKSRVALARKLAAIMLAIWKKGEAYAPRLSNDSGPALGDEAGGGRSPMPRACAPPEAFCS